MIEYTTSICLMSLNEKNSNGQNNHEIASTNEQLFPQQTIQKIREKEIHSIETLLWKH